MAVELRPDRSAYLIRSDKKEKCRAAAVARSPEELCGKLRKVTDCLSQGKINQLSFEEGVFLSGESMGLRLCLLFPGQGIAYRSEDWPFYKRIVGSSPLPSPL